MKTREEKLQAAIEQLGERYVLHKTNSVKKEPRRAPEIRRADVARTIRRFIKRKGLDLV